MVGHERPCIGPTGLGVQNRRFHFSKAVVVHVLPYGLDDRSPLVETLEAFRIRNQVQVPLPVDGLRVSNPFPLIWQWPQRLGQEGNLVGPDGQFTGISLDHIPFNSKEVTNISPLKDMVRFVTYHVFPSVNLNFTSPVYKVCEARLTTAPLPGHPAGNRDHFTLFVQFVLVILIVFVMQVLGQVVALKAAAKRFDPGLLEFFHFFPTDAHLI